MKGWRNLVLFLLILFENLFKPCQRRLTVGMLLTSSALSATSKQCFELTSSVLSTTSKQCFEQPTASFLVCSLIFIEYKVQQDKAKPRSSFLGFAYYEALTFYALRVD